MKFSLASNGKRVIICKKDDAVCKKCNEKEPREWYFCEQDKVLYCNKCIRYWGKHFFHTRWDHQDWLIDEVTNG